MGYIYKVTNLINHKLYIGQTSLQPAIRRWQTHCSEYKYWRNRHRPFYDAILKYGVDNFCFEVIEEVEDGCLDKREQYYIQLYRTYIGFEDCNGYNATLGGECYKTVCCTDEQLRDIITDYRNGLGMRAIGKKYHLAECSIRRLLVDNNIPLRKCITPVCQIDKHTQLVIQCFDSAKEAERVTGIQNSHINECCRHKRKSAGGFMWEYCID